MSKPRIHLLSGEDALCGRLILNRMTLTINFASVTCPQCRSIMAGQPLPQFDEADHADPETMEEAG